MKRFLILFTLIVIFVVLASGCVIIGRNTMGPTTRTYSGDKLPKLEVAVIKGYWFLNPGGYGGVDIFSIDGNDLEATKVELLPGRHELVIRNYTFSFVAPIGAAPMFTRGSFNSEAGHEYKIKCQLFTPGCKIVDVTTGARILNLPPFKEWREFRNR